MTEANRLALKFLFTVFLVGLILVLLLAAIDENFRDILEQMLNNTLNGTNSANEHSYTVEGICQTLMELPLQVRH